MRCAKAGVFHHHGQRNFGFISGCKRHVKRMVALKFFEFFAVVFVFLANRYRLRCAGFSARQITRTGKHPRRCAFLRHAHQRPANQVHMLWPVAQIFRRITRQALHVAGHRVLRANHQARLVFDSVVGQYGGSLCQLQHGEGVVALPNTERNGFAGVPLLLLCFFVGFTLPGLAGQHTGQLAVDVNTGDLPKAKRLHEVVHGVHAQLVGQRVVVHVA